MKLKNDAPKNHRRVMVLLAVMFAAGAAVLLIFSQDRREKINFDEVMEFDGQGDYVQIAHHPEQSLDVFTVEAWAAPSSIGRGWQTLVAKDEAGIGRNYGFWLNPGSLRLHVSICGGGDPNNYQSHGGLPLDTWTHIAMTYSGTLLSVYLNGELDGTFPPASKQCASDAGVWIGGYRPQPDSWSDFAGKITDVRIWNTVRTAGEIRANMQVRLTGTEPGLVSYWTLADAAAGQGKNLAGQQDGAIFR